jgi:hypothetical protein
MRLPTKSGFATATILTASFGFAGWTHAAPLAGLAAAVPAVQMTQDPSAFQARPEKAYHHGYRHHDALGLAHHALGLAHHALGYHHRPYGYRHGHYGYHHRPYGYHHRPYGYHHHYHSE